MPRFVVALVLLLGLSGCFTSSEPLIAADKAVFPFQTIEFRSKGSDQPNTLVHEGDFYVAQDENGEHGVRLRLLDAGDGFYVVEVNSEKEDPPVLLHALLKIDRAAGTAESYKAMAPDAGKEAIPATGLHRCAKDQICVDRLDAYVAYAKAAVAAGQTPDVIYEFTGTP